MNIIVIALGISYSCTARSHYHFRLQSRHYTPRSDHYDNQDVCCPLIWESLQMASLSQSFELTESNVVVIGETVRVDALHLHLILA